MESHKLYDKYIKKEQNLRREAYSLFSNEDDNFIEDYIIDKLKKSFTDKEILVINKYEEFILGKLKRRLRDTINKTNDPKIIFRSANLFKVKLTED